MEKSNKKSWLSRLKYLKIRHKTSSSSQINCNNENFQQRNVSPHENHASLSVLRTSRFQRRNSFRTSFINARKCLKTVFTHNRNNDDFSDSSTNPRVTLNSPVSHDENTYSLEPVEILNSFHVEQPQIPPRINLASTNEVDSSSSTTTPVISPRSRNFPQLTMNINNGCIPKNDVANLSKFYWYWGPISKAQAEARLKDFPDGAFLIRDSCSDRHIFTVSFRNLGKILHSRIELSKSGYSLFDQTGYSSISELVEDAVAKSKNGVYCYTKPKDGCTPFWPVRLTLPVSRYEKVPSLKCLARLVIKQYVINDDMDKLPLPLSLIDYLKERQYL